VSLYAARKTIEAVITVATVNTEIGLLNTALGESAASITAVANGAYTAADDVGTYPCLLYYVGVLDPARTQVPITGKRDFLMLPCALAVHARGHSLETVNRDVELVLEALLPLVDSLRGTTLGATPTLQAWGILDVRDLSVVVMPYTDQGKVIRLDGIMRFNLLARRTGV
jgi:hypothetical protein